MVNLQVICIIAFLILGGLSTYRAISTKNTPAIYGWVCAILWCLNTWMHCN